MAVKSKISRISQALVYFMSPLQLNHLGCDGVSFATVVDAE